jgi:hypothetical protein
MKSAFRWMMLLGVCVACFGMQLPTTVPGNVLANPDFEAGMDAWSYVSEGNAVGSVERIADMPLSESSPHSLKLIASQLGQRCGIANTGGPSGINVTQGQWYMATFYARAEGPRGIGLVFSLETPDGKKVCGRTTLPEIGRGGEIGKPVQGTNWREYTVSVHAYASDPHCRLVISPIEPGTLYFDNISLVQRASGAARGNP